MGRTHVDVGTTLGARFEITGLIGGGGMAFVYRAIDHEYDRPAAVKVMQARLARLPEFRQRFQKEAFLANRASHQHILPVWASGEDRGYFYIATPLADTDLASLIARHPDGLPPRRALDIIGKVAWALDFAHSQGVIHRDVKPENVLIAESPDPDTADHVWLSDFGIAKNVDGTARLTAATAPFTPATAAPEQIQGGRRLDGRVDQYALTCTLYDALCGAGPFSGYRTNELLHAHLAEPPPAISARNPALLPALDAVIARGMAKSPDARYRSCLDMVHAARQALGLSGSGALERPGAHPNGTATVADGELTECDTAGAEAEYDTRKDATEHEGAEGSSTPWYRRAGVLAAAVVILALGAGAGVYALATDHAATGSAASTLGGQSDDAAGTPEPTGTPPETPTATATETAEPTATPTPSSIPAPTSDEYAAEDMEALWAKVPYDDCDAVEWETVTELGDEPLGTIAAITCDVPSHRRVTATYLLFDSAAAMRAAFSDYRVNGAFSGEYDVTERSCDGITGLRTWSSHGARRGQMDCVSVPYDDGDTQNNVIWTASAARILSVLYGGAAMATLFDVWYDAGPVL